MRSHGLILILGFLVVVACGGDDDCGLGRSRCAPEPDAGPTRDAATGDGGVADAAMGDGGAGDDGGRDDGGRDAGTPDGGGSDGGPRDAGTSDGGPPADGGSCDPSAVSFPMGGSLAPGTLCDDVFVCVTDAADAARVTGASAAFSCSAAPKGPCSSWTCVLRPGVLDAAEVAEICAVTRLSPTPSIVCRVYL